MKKIFLLSFVLLAVYFGGCGGSSKDKTEDNLTANEELAKKKEYNIIVERGAVFHAKVMDFDGNTARDNGTNTYTFTKKPSYPISVLPSNDGKTFIDVDGDKTRDFNLSKPLFTCEGNFVTPITTALKIQTNCQNQEDFYKNLAQKYKLKIQELKKLPSNQDINTSIFTNAIYDAIEENSTKVDYEKVAQNINILQQLVKEKNLNTSSQIELAFFSNSSKNPQENLDERPNYDSIEIITPEYDTTENTQNNQISNDSNQSQTDNNTTQNTDDQNITQENNQTSTDDQNLTQENNSTNEDDNSSQTVLQNIILDKTFFQIEYSPKYKGALRVSYTITKEQVEAPDLPRFEEFYTDEYLPQEIATTSDDYINTGFDRGHLAPDASLDYDRDAQYATYVMSNIVPQYPEINRKVWVKVEKKERREAKKYLSVDVINLIDYNNSTIFTKIPSEKLAEGKTFSSQEHKENYIKAKERLRLELEAKKIHVPVGFTKIIKNDAQNYAECFYIPNKKHLQSWRMSDYKIDCSSINY